MFVFIFISAALFLFRIGSSTRFTSVTPKYKRIIWYTLKGNMGTHVDNHHCVGAVSVVLRPGREGNALYTCYDKDPDVEKKNAKVLICLYLLAPLLLHLMFVCTGYGIH